MVHLLPKASGRLGYAQPKGGATLKETPSKRKAFEFFRIDHESTTPSARPQNRENPASSPPQCHSGVLGTPTYASLLTHPPPQNSKADSKSSKVG